MGGYGRSSAATTLALIVAVAYVSSMLTPTAAYTPVTCGNGQYKSNDNCYNCQAGRYKTGNNEASSCTECPAGKYQASTGQSACNNCAGGYYQGSKGQTSCHQCGTGHYCGAGSTGRTACPAGRYGNSATESSSNCKGACNAGRYGGSGETSADCSKECPAGYYCPAGSSSYSSQCSAGRYGYKLQTSSSCTGPCNAGRYGGAGQTSASCSGACAEGYYCGSGSSSSTQYACGSDQYYCTGGSRYEVPTQYYSTGVSGRRTGKALCPIGYYCNRGRKHACPAGRFGSTTGLATADCSGPCTAGYYCPEGSTTATQSLCGGTISGAKARSIFCPGGTSSPFTIGNEYRVGAEASRRGSATAVTMGASGHHGSDSSHSAEYGRLGSIEWPGGGVGAWCAPDNRADVHHLDFTLAAPTTVSGVMTQARDGQDGDWTWRQCVTQYRMRAYDLNAEEWVWVDGGKVFTGNNCPTGSDTSPVVTARFSTAVYAQQLQLWPRAWSGHICMRAELLGQSENGITTPEDASAMMKTGWAPCPEGGQCVDGEDIRVRVAFSDINCKTLGKDDVYVNEETGGTIKLKSYEAIGEGGVMTFSVTRVAADPVPGATEDCPSGDLFTLPKVGTNGELTISTADGIDFEGCNYIDVDIKVEEAENENICRVRVNIVDQNDDPTIPAGQVREVEETAERNEQFGEPLLASDPDRDQSLLFEIIGGNIGDAFQISRCSGQLSVNNPVLDFETRPSYTLQVQVEDDDLAKVFAYVTVNVINANDPPVFGSVSEYTTPELTVGSCTPTACMAAAVDPEGGSLTYTISRQDQPQAWDITSGGELVVSKAKVLNFEVKTSYSLKIKATDADGGETEKDFTITIGDSNEPPVASPVTFEVAENSPAGHLVGVVNARDDDSDSLPTGTLTFSIVEGNTDGAFAIDSDGFITVANSAALNYEGTAHFVLTVRASDVSASPLHGDARVDIFLSDVNELDTIDDATFSVPEDAIPGQFVGAIQVNKVDVGQLYVFTATGATSTFNVDAVSGVITFKAGTLDAEGSTTSYVLTVTAQDNGTPAKSDSATITVTVANVPEAPVLTSTAFSVAENSPVNTAVGTLTAVDPEGQPVTFSVVNSPGQTQLFKVVGNVLRVKTAELNHEGHATHDVTIAMDDGSEQGEGIVVVTVTNVEENPVIVSNPVRSIAETAAVGTVVQGGPVQAYDPESQQMKLTIEGGNTGSAFAVNEETMEVYLARSGVLNFNSKPEYVLNMRVATDSSSTGLTYFDMRILIADDNEPPVVPTGQTFTVKENAKAGDPVGTVSGSDPDVGQQLSWAVEGSSDFTIDNSGKLTVSSKAQLSFEHIKSYEFNVRATDNGSPAPLSGSALITVNIQDVNEAPSLGATTLSVPEDATAGFVLGTVTGADPDTTSAFNTLSYSIESGGDGLFAIHSSTGVVSLASAGLDFEIVNTYTLKVAATDPLGLKATANVVVNVENRNDRPTLASVSFNLQENTPAGASIGQPLRAFDQEANTQALTYHMSGTNCWRSEVGPSADPYFTPSEVATPGSVDMTLRIKAERFGIVYLAEAPSTDAPHYRVSIGAPFSTVTTKLHRCLPQADGSGNLCEVVDEADTPSVSYSADDFTSFWVSAETTPAVGVATPAFEFSRAETELPIGAGADDVVQRADETGVAHGDGARTMMAWVKPALAGGIPLSFGAGQTATCGLGFALLLNENSASVLGGCDDHNIDNIVTPSSTGDYAVVHDGDWHHVAVTYAGAGGDVRLLVDGAVVGTAAAPTAYSTGAGYMLGSWADNSFVYSGSIRDARFYSSVVSDADIARAVAGTDRVVTVRVGSGSDSVADDSVLATLVDDTSLVAPPVATYVGVATEFGSVATFTSICFDGAPPLAGDLVFLSVAGVMTTRMSPNYEERSGYSFEVTVTDTGTPPMSDTAVVTVLITDINEAPWFIPTGDCVGHDSKFDACFSVLEIRSPFDDPGTPWVVGRILVADQEDDAEDLKLSISAGNVQGAFAINPSTGVVTVANPAALNYEVQPYNLFEITIKVQDADPVSPHRTDGFMRIETRDVNEPPTLDAQVRSVKELTKGGAFVGLPIVATDVDSGVFGELTFSLSGSDNVLPNGDKIFNIDPKTGQVTVSGKKALDFERINLYELTLNVVDGGGLSASNDLTINIIDVNERPNLDDVLLEVRENSPVATLIGDALNGTDPDIGQFLLYTMERSSDSGPFKLGACSGQLEVAVAELDFETKDLYTLYVTVTDDGVDPYKLSDTAVITILILDVNEPPEIDDAARNVDENTAVGVPFGEALVGRDVDRNQTLTYSLVAPRTDNEAITIDPVTGVLEVAKDELDFESKPTFSVTVRVDDNGVDPHPMFATATVSISLNDVNEPPVLVEGQVLSVPENSAVGTAVNPNVHASDPDAGDKISFAMATHPALYMVGSTIKVADKSLMDHETDASYTVSVTVTDVGGLSATGDVTVLVTDVNEPPIFTDTTLEVPENSPIGTAVGSALAAQDVDFGQTLTYSFVTGPGSVQVQEFSFSTLNPNQIEVRQPVLDHETKDTYSFEVRVRDSGQPQLQTAALVTVNVLDVNEAPWLNPVTFHVDENTKCTQAGADPIACPNVGQPLQGDDFDDGDTLTYTISGGDGASVFELVGAQLRMLPCDTWATTGCLNHEAKETYTVHVTVSDSGTPALSSVGTVTIIVDDVNEAPTIAPQSRTLPEKLTLDKPASYLEVGAEVAASDVDVDAVLTYLIGPCVPSYGIPCDHLTGNDDGMFFMDPNSGQISLADPTPARYVPGTVVPLMVMVVDQGGLSANATVSITITNVNDKPVIVQTPPLVFTIPEDATVGTVVVPSLTITDDDVGQSHTLALVRGEPAVAGDLFSLDSVTGEVKLAQGGLDHEQRDEYRLYVTATDDHPEPLSGAAWITIKVGDVNESPSVVGPVSMTVKENEADIDVGLPIIASDPDEGDTAALKFSLVSVPPGGTTLPFTIVESTGQVRVVAEGGVNFEEQDSYTFTVLVEDPKTPPLTATTTLTITVLDVNERCTVEDATFGMNEGEPAGYVVGQVIASDVDARDVLSYKLNNQPYFGITHAGAIYTVAPIDYEEATQHVLTVTVTDNGKPTPLSNTGTVTINVADLNDVTLTGFSSSGNAADTPLPFGTKGGDWVYLHGTNFGPRTLPNADAASAPTVVATYGRLKTTEYTATECHVVADPNVALAQINTLIKCKTAPGTGKDLRWAVTINGGTPGVKGGAGSASSILGQVTRYRAPAITSIEGAKDMPTSGSTQLTIHGSDFGQAGTFVAVRYGPEGSGFLGVDCAVSADTPHELMTCKSAAGVGGVLSWVVEIDSLVSAVHTGDYSYAAPTLTGITGEPLLSTPGGEELKFQGDNFGAASGISAGVGVPGLSGVVGVFYQNAHGYRYDMVSCAVTVAHKEIVCRTAPGVGKDHTFTVVVGGQSSTTAPGRRLAEGTFTSVSYKPPEIHGIDGPGAWRATTVGGQEVVISGKHFGPKSTSPGAGSVSGGYGRISEGGDWSQRYPGVDCAVTVAHTQMRCKTSVGTGADYAWRVNVGEQDSTVFTETLASYAPPVVINFKGVGAFDADTDGGETVVVEGRQFGTVAANSIDRVTYGETGFEYNATCSVTTDHTAITCTTDQGAGLALRWKVVIDGQASVTPTTEYAPPSITSLTGDATAGVDVSALLSDGGQVVVIGGDDFGPSDEYLATTYGSSVKYLGGVTYGPTGLEYAAKGCTVKDHDRVECTTLPGVGENLKWMLTVKGQTSDLSTVTTSYGRPTIDTPNGLSVNHARTNGGKVITISGVNFGLLDPTATVSVSFGGALPALVPTSKSLGAPVDPSAPAGTPRQHLVSFTVPEGQGRDIDIRVLVTDSTGTVYDSNPVTFNYDDPQIVTVVPEVGATASSRFLIIEGNNFGTHGEVQVTYIGPDDTEVTDVLNPSVYTHERIETSFNGLEGAITIKRGDETSNTVSFKQLAPSISNLCGNNGDNPLFHTPGGEDLTVSVNNIGTAIEAIAVTVGGLPCNVTSLVPVTAATQAFSGCSGGAVVTEDMDLAEVTCTVPEGQGRQKDVVIYRLGQSSRLGVAIDYYPPTVAAVSPKLVNTDGGDWVTVTGINFGHFDADLLLNNDVPFTECEFVSTHTVLRCRAPAGEGLPKTLGPLSVFEGLAAFSDGQKWTNNDPATNGLVVGYIPPEVTEYNLTMPTAGGVLALRGNNFGRSPEEAPNVPRKVEVVTSTGALVSRCNITHWDHHDIVCNLWEGEGADLRIVVTVAGQSSAGVPFRFDEPVVEWFTPASAPTKGGHYMIVGGDNFGLHPTVWVGGYSPEEIIWKNHTSLEFLVPEGAGFDLQVRVETRGQWSANTANLFEYDPPKLLGIEIHTGTGAELAHPGTVGGDIITLTGTSLSKFDGVVVLAGGRIHDPARCVDILDPEKRALCTKYHNQRIIAPGPDLKKHDHEEVKFLMPEGMGTDIQVYMIVGGRTSIESPRLTVSYRAPSVERVSPDISHARGDSVQIIGSDFGENDDPRNQNVTVIVDGMPCLDVDFEPRKTTASYNRNPRISCRTPPMTVGWKSFEVYAARQSESILGNCNGTAKCERMRAECRVGSYGADGEWCLSCPRGASCAGSLAEPIAKKEWWLQNSTREVDCPAADSPEAAELDSYLEAIHRFETGGPLEWRAVDKDTGLLVRYTTVDEFCAHHPRVCAITHCKRVFNNERLVAPMAVPCDPKWACTGNNTCATGYDGWRCSECNTCFKVNPEDKCRRYYKRAGECVECPDNPWILAAGFLLAVILACTAGYIVNKKNLHLAFLSIGVDYFQILAIFANSRVMWPPLIKEIFHLMSVFNFNLEITAPECSIPDLGYYTKWMFIEALPLAAITLFALGHVALLLYKKCILCRSGKTTGHVNVMVGSLFLLLYYLYLYITRTTLDVFNCAPTDPYDGYTYLSVVFERCWEPGGIHLRLLPYAICTLLAYTIMYPATVGLILRKYRYKIMEDQLLLAQGKGRTRLTNPNAYDVRKRYHKLYYHFKPDYYYWILVVIARKFLIAFTALMFTKNPAFQLSISLLIVFTSYVLQVKNRPYMSMSERDDVLADHARHAVEDGPGSVHALLADNLGNIQRRDKKKSRNMFGRSSRQDQARKAAEQAASFFFNYNTVEAVLLCCAVLVNLSGIMFESGQFDSEYYQEQRNMVSYFVLTVIFTSITYFCIVLWSEVRATVCPNFCSRGKKGSLSKSPRASSKKRSSLAEPRAVDDDVIQFTNNAAASGVSNAFANPMFGAAAQQQQTDTSNDSEEVTALRGALRRQTREIERLTEELKNTKQAAMRGDLNGLGNTRKKKGRRRASLKREFLGQRVVGPNSRRRRTSSTDDTDNDNGDTDGKDDTPKDGGAARQSEVVSPRQHNANKREFRARPAAASGRNRSARRLRLPTTRKTAPPAVDTTARD